VKNEMNARTERLRHLYGWDSAYATMTPVAPNSYKYPDGIVLTLKTTNHAEHYFVERAFALQLANSIKESLVNKKGKAPRPKPAEAKPAKPQKKAVGKVKPRPD
jgi:hypothetical protein